MNSETMQSINRDQSDKGVVNRIQMSAGLREEKVRMKNGDHYCGLPARVCVKECFSPVLSHHSSFFLPRALNSSSQQCCENERSIVSNKGAITHMTHRLHFHKVVLSGHDI